MSQALTADETLKLEPARLDLSTQTTQLAIACLVTLIAAVTAFATTVNLGFIGNDYTVVHSAAAATEGGAAAFFVSLNNQAMINPGYGPLALAVLMLLQAVFGTNAAFFHFINIFLFALCTLLVMQLASQLCNRYSSRLAASAAVWSGLLYAAHPVHASIVASATGSPDLLCQLLCLFALFCYLRLRCLQERSYLIMSLLSFAAAVFIKAEVCTLPLIILVGEILLFAGDRTEAYKRVLLPSAFFMVLVFTATIAFLPPWHIPVSPLSISLEDSIKLVCHRDIWQRLLGLSSEAAGGAWSIVELSVFGAAAILLFVRLLKKTAAYSALLFLGFWLVASLVADGTGAPSLGAPRCLLCASAPLCIALALLCLPAIDKIDRRWAQRMASLGSLLLLSLFACYVSLLGQQLQYWNLLSQQTRAICQAVAGTSKRLPAGKGVLVGALPADLSGDWVRFAFTNPFVDAHGMVASIPERLTEGNAIWPQLFASAMRTTDCGAVLRFGAESGPLIEWDRPQGAATFTCRFDNARTVAVEAQGANSQASFDQRKHSQDGSAAAGTPGQCQVKDGALYVTGGSQPFTAWITAPSINPLQADAAQIDMEYKGLNGASTPAENQIKLLWQTGTGGRARRQQGSAAVVYHDRLGYLVWLGRYPSWTLSNSVLRFGLQFAAGAYRVKISRISLVSDAVLSPKLSLAASGKEPLLSPWTVLFAAKSTPTLRFDVSHMPGANGMRLAIWNERAQFAPQSQAQLYDINPTNSLKAAFHGDFIVRSDAVTLSPDLFSLACVYYARAIAIDQNDKPFGLPTEPLAFRFKRQ